MGAKDWVVEKAAAAMLNQAVMKPYGTLTRLKLDTTARTIEAELELKGETQPVILQVQAFEIIEEGAEAYFLIKGMTTSREWLTALARDHVVDRKFKIPASVRAYLPMIL